MSVQSIENPAPIYNTSIFIPKLWSNTTKNINSITTLEITDFIGDISLYTGTALPPKFLWCDGTLQNKNLYPDLYNLLLYRYGGSGDNFGLPDFRNRNIINYTSSCYTTNSVPQVTYNSTCTSVSGNRTMTSSQLETHDHAYNISPTTDAVTSISTNTAPRSFNAFSSRNDLLDSVGYTVDNILTQGTISTIPSSQTNLYSPFVVVNYIIRALL